jgi:hypothetical protein
MNSPALLLLASAAISRSRDLSAKKARRKKLPAKIPCNALISLDSVERIQGNPRESNVHNLGFLPWNGLRQENPNRPDGASGRPLAEAPNRPLRNAKRL